MLDAVLPTATYVTANVGQGVEGYTTSSINAYRDSLAKTAGYAYLNSIIGVFDGTYWKPINDSNKVLSGDFKVQVNASDIGGVAGNGLIYTIAGSPFVVTNNITLKSRFGVKKHSIATCNNINLRWNTANVCRVRNMLLPTYLETSLSVAYKDSPDDNPCGGAGDSLNGVPSVGYMLTSTAIDNGGLYYFLWNGISGVSNIDGDNYAGNVRCVR